MTIEEMVKKEYEMTGIKKYHDLGYLGQGITILNHENNTGHSFMTDSILKDIAPEAKIINAEVSASTSGGVLTSYIFRINGENLTPEEMYDMYHPDIMSVSFCGHNELKEARIKPLVDKGLVICCATGNYGTEKGDYGMYADISISVGSVALTSNGKSIQLNAYSGRGDIGDVTFVAFNGTGDGTSAATPFLSGMVALLMSRFGKMNQDTVIDVMKESVIDLGDYGLDADYGYGLPVLPDEIKEVIDMKFKDVEDSRWSANAINWASDSGIVTGYEDGTFRPTTQATREEIAVMMKRLYDLLKK